MSWDVVVLGGGHNGLVAATTLAQARKRVLLLEARESVGGVGAAREFHAGYTVPGLLHETSRFRPEVVDGLKLAQHGLHRRTTATGYYAPTEGEEGLWIRGDAVEGPISDGDREQYRAHRAFLSRIEKVVRKVVRNVAAST